MIQNAASEAAAALGSICTDKKAKASKLNGRNGGRPRKNELVNAQKKNSDAREKAVAAKAGKAAQKVSAQKDE